MVDEDEMCWPLLRMVQRPHAPFDERLKRVFVCVISRDVAESPRLTLDGSWWVPRWSPITTTPSRKLWTY